MWPKVIALVAHFLLAAAAITATTLLALKGDIPGSTAVASITTFAGIGAGGSVASMVMSSDSKNLTNPSGE